MRARRFRKPSLWNTVKYRWSLLPIFNDFSEFPMSTSRRNVIVRCVTSMCGDAAIAVVVVSGCAWIIEAASFGLFMSFLVWLVATLAALAFSQLVLHPVVNMVLSDRKFDGSIDAVVGLVQGFDAVGGEALDSATRYAKSAWSRMRNAS
jgi:triacylglycerol esterase/lipase EstA (alpha/beta hydrolase family)